jgi:glutamyl-tRNA synthetase
VHGGAYGPYRQSERKATYTQYAQILMEKGFAYYAFDTPEDLEEKRKQVPNFQYSRAHRMEMKNSISLSENEVTELLKKGTPHVIRIKVPDEEDIVFTDMIRGEVRFDVNTVDDKVLLKADGMPTYHLAVVVDDFLMKITHAFRGEEWLPSAPVHILLWKYLFGLDKMPKWAHLPLILKPEGSGKLSKRDGERLGFPVFAMDWNDPNTKETTIGFKEKGFLPEAFINFLALLGWNDGTDKEIFSLDELIASFDIERVHKGGAKFDYEKAKWFNQEWIKRTDNKELAKLLQPFLDAAKIEVHEAPYLVKVIGLVKDRCHLLADFIAQSHFFFAAPSSIDIAAILPKWEEKKQVFFEALVKTYAQHISDGVKTIPAATLEANFKELATAHEIKPGDLLLPLRIMLVGGKFGPGVFDIIESIELSDTVARIEHSLRLISGK